MKNNRRFYKQDLYHLYNRSIDGSLLFYTDTDFIVFASIIFSFSRKYAVRLSDVCIMYNHFHIAVRADSREALTSFYKEIMSQLFRIFNARPDKVKIKLARGKSSAKYDPKKVNNCHLYIGNNPVEKHFCRHAVEYRWNFLKYYNPERILPEAFLPEKRSETLEVALAIVRAAVSHEKPLKHSFFDIYENKLEANEWEALKDYAIRVNNVIDYSDIECTFYSFDDYLALAGVSAGSEYEMKEDNLKEDYGHYAQLKEQSKAMGFEGNDSRIHESDFDMSGTIRILAFRTSASNLEISRFLHIPEVEVQAVTGRRY